MRRSPAKADPRTQELARELRTLRPRATPVLRDVTKTLRDVLGARTACAYGLHVGEDDRVVLDFIHLDGAPADAEELSREWFKGAPIPWGLFDPTRPEPRQRNQAVTTGEIDQAGAPPKIVQELYPKIGIAGDDQLRVLVCEGSSLLGWVGAWRPEPFTARDKQVMQALVPALQERLTVERQLQLASLHEAALAAALEQLGAEAYLVSETGVVAHANRAGQERLGSRIDDTRQDLRDAIAGKPTRFRLQEIAVAGMPKHYLAIAQTAPDDAITRVLAVAPRWTLTPRQTQVLVLVAEGLSNRAIAAQLSCSESTVEIHVSAILSKASACSRAELIARVWTGD